MTTPPVVRAVGDAAVLVEFGAVIDDAVHRRVLSLDAALAAVPPPGVLEMTPAYTSLLVAYDPLATSFHSVRDQILAVSARMTDIVLAPAEHRVPVCYDGPHAPDLATVAQMTGQSADAVIAQHLAATFRVYIYGFAPGYAYMGGLPEVLQLPRKPAAVRGHPVGSVLIAGRQCLIAALAMPTGWWVIGRSPLLLLDPSGAQAVPFQPGDHVRFARIGAAAFDDRAAR